MRKLADSKRNMLPINLRTKKAFQLSSKILTCFIVATGIASNILAATPSVKVQGNQTVTLDAPGWSLAKICEAISQQIGQKVAAHGDCVTDHLIVKVHNVPWSVLQQKLAWAEYGHWTSINNVLTIERDPKQVQARIQKNIDNLTAKIAEQFKKDKATSKPFDAKQFVRSFISFKERFEATEHDPKVLRFENGTYAALIEMSNQTPFAVHFRDFMDTFPPKVLAEIPFGTRVVFSNHPTSLQLALPESVQQSIQIAADEQKQLLEALTAAGVDLSRFQEYAALGPIDSSNTINIAISHEYGVDIDANLRIFSNSGDLVVYESLAFGNSISDSNNGSPNQPVTQCKLSPETIQLYHQLADPTSITPSDVLLQTLRKPLQIDPLAVIVTPILSAIAPDKNIVINDDWLLNVPYALSAQKDQTSVPSNFLSANYLLENPDVDSSDTWFNLRTPYVCNLPTQNIPRVSYDNVVQTTSPDGLFDFVPSMRFAASIGPTACFLADPASVGLRPLGFGSNPFDAELQPWGLFCLVGSLDDGQLNQAESKEGLNLSTLAPNSKDILKSILLAHFMDTTYHTFKSADPRQRLKLSIIDEPTYTFAQSMPNAVLTITLHKSTKIQYSFTGSVNGQPQLETCDAMDIGSRMDTFGYLPGWKSDFSHMKLFPDYKYTITITFLGTNLPQFTADFDTQSYSSKIYNGVDSLPDDIRKEAETQLQYFKDWHAKHPPHGG